MNSKNELSIAEAISAYLGTIEDTKRADVNKELQRFLRWYGSDRSVSKITPPEIGQFAEYIGNAVQDYAKVFESLRPFLSYVYKQHLNPVSLSPHLRLEKAPVKIKIGPRKTSSERATLTVEGYAKLEKELKSLRDERPIIADELRKAAADKDFRENAPLDAAREHQGQLEARIRALEAMLATAMIIDSQATTGNSEVVAMGDTVRVRNKTTTEEMEYKIVGQGEADLKTNRISSISPLGKALLGGIKGKEISISVPAGTQYYEIIEIKRL